MHIAKWLVVSYRSRILSGFVGCTLLLRISTQILVLGMESEFSEPEVDSQEEIQETREAGCTPKPKPGSCMCASTSVIYDSHSDVSEDA